MGNIVTDSTPDKPTKEQIIDELNLIANASESSLEFLKAVSEKYQEWEDFVDAITAWLGLEGVDKEFLIDIIEQSTKLDTSTKVRWKLVNLKNGTEQNKHIVGEAIKAKKLNIGADTQSETLGLIQEIREYHPAWRIKREREEKRKRQLSTGDLTGELMTPATEALEVEMRQIELASAQAEAQSAQAKQRKEEQKRKLDKLEEKAQTTTDVSMLKKILGELYKYTKEFPVRVEEIRRTIRAKIARIQTNEKQEQPQNQSQTSEFNAVKIYILLGLAQGDLDIEEAKNKIEKYANTFASTSTTCRIPSARITPNACKTQLMLAVYQELRTNACAYPIIESKETYVIQQLISLGLDERSATGAVIEHLCLLKRFGDANSLIEAYKTKYETIKVSEIEDKGEQRRILEIKEILPVVIRNWNNIVFKSEHKQTSTGKTNIITPVDSRVAR